MTETEIITTLKQVSAMCDENSIDDLLKAFNKLSIAEGDSIFKQLIAITKETAIAELRGKNLFDRKGI